MKDFKLPRLIEMAEYGYDFNRYFEAVYAVFKKDFVDSKPVFRGVRLGLKKYPTVVDKEYTFYHMTHEGDIEHDRKPCFRRMERIRFPRPMIDNSQHPELKVWKNVRRGKGGTKTRILILNEKERYLVVLDERPKFILPWTAYYLRSTKELGKKLEEYDKYKSAEAAKIN